MGGRTTTCVKTSTQTQKTSYQIATPAHTQAITSSASRGAHHLNQMERALGSRSSVTPSTAHIRDSFPSHVLGYSSVSRHHVLTTTSQHPVEATRYFATRAGRTFDIDRISNQFGFLHLVPTGHAAWRPITDPRVRANHHLWSRGAGEPTRSRPRVQPRPNQRDEHGDHGDQSRRTGKTELVDQSSKADDG